MDHFRWQALASQLLPNAPQNFASDSMYLFKFSTYFVFSLYILLAWESSPSEEILSFRSLAGNVMLLLPELQWVWIWCSLHHFDLSCKTHVWFLKNGTILNQKSSLWLENAFSQLQDGKRKSLLKWSKVISPLVNSFDHVNQSTCRIFMNLQTRSWRTN